MEKASRKHLHYLMPYRKNLLELAAISQQKEVRWHMSQIMKSQLQKRGAPYG